MTGTRVAGGLLLGAIALARAAPGGSMARALGDPNSGDLWHRRTALAGLAGVGAIYLLLLPIGPLIHELVPTPKRLLIGTALTAGCSCSSCPSSCCCVAAHH